MEIIPGIGPTTSEDTFSPGGIKYARSDDYDDISFERITAKSKNKNALTLDELKAIEERRRAILLRVSLIL